jgi:hypothetical protein
MSNTQTNDRTIKLDRDQTRRWGCSERAALCAELLTDNAEGVRVVGFHGRTLGRLCDAAAVAERPQAERLRANRKGSSARLLNGAGTEATHVPNSTHVAPQRTSRRPNSSATLLAPAAPSGRAHVNAPLRATSNATILTDGE